MREYLQLHLRQTLNILETAGGLSAALIVALIAPRLGRRIFHRIERWLARIARSPRRAILLALSAHVRYCGSSDPANPRRVQLSARRRYIRAWPAYQSAPA
jgi:hypothetical protein